MKKPSTASLRYFALLLGTVGMLWSVSVSFADDPRQWGPPGQPIRQGHHIEWQRAAYTDANGYTLMVWSDTRTGDRDVFAQLIEPDGDLAPGWPVHVVNYPFRQEDPEPIVTNGGFIIAWIDFRYDSTGDVFAQKLDLQGNKLWAPDGVVVDTFTTSMTNETTLRGATDGAGGAVIAWEDTRRGDAADIFAQRILSNGVRGWANVVSVTDASGLQSGITADTDGQGGLIVGWNDNRDGGNVFAAKITNTGSLPWGGAGGRAVCDFTSRQLGLKLCPDYTSGGAYFVWQDERDGTSNNLYMQRFNGAGDAQWTEDGIVVCSANDDQRGARITPSFNNDAQDGVLICWQDVRENGSVEEVYTQKVNGAGSHLWTANGVKVCGDAGPGGVGASRDNSRLTSDLAGGGMYVWDDTRHDAGDITQYNTYIQHLNAQGDAQCVECGFAVNTGNNQQQEAVLRMSPDGSDVFCIYSDFYRGSRTVRVAQGSVDGCDVERDQEVIFGLDGDATNPMNVRMFWGNVAFVWEDNRGVNFGKQIYYQVLDTTYERTFAHIPENGAPLAPVSLVGDVFGQSKPFVCTDDNDGFFCAFENLSDGLIQIRLQRVGSDGTLQCDEAGAIVSASGVDQKDAQVVPDGSGGCYVVWAGFDPNFILDVFAMRMDENCQPMWTEPAVLSSDAESDDSNPVAVADGNGCVIAIWQTGEFGQLDVKAAKVCGDGTVAWQSPVSTMPRNQQEPQIASDGQGGVYMVWSDDRDEIQSKDIYGQHFNSLGQAQWTNNGRLIVTFLQDQKLPRLAVDGQSRVFVVWQDFRNGTNLDLYGQKLNPDGSRIWPETTGRWICGANSDQSDQQMLVEWNDGLYMVWEDGRTNPYSDIYGVHINDQHNIAEPWWNQSSGETPLGGVVNGEYQYQTQPALAHDYHGGVSAVWVDWRSSGKEPLQNIWGNWVNDGTVNVREIPAPLPRDYMLTQNFPNPFNPTTEFRFTVPATEAVKINVFNTVGQQVSTLVDEVMHAGTYQVRFDASALSSGTYFYRLETPSFQTVKKMVLIK